MLLVPRGAEAAAVRRAHPAARVVEVRAGRHAAANPPAFAAGDVAVVLGLAGALREHRTGDAVAYRSVADADGRVALTDPHDAGIDTASLPNCALADACTVDHVVTTRTERAALAARWSASVVDMEGTHLARALAARGVPCVMLRAISDDAARDLPALERAITADGGVDGLRIARAFLRAPLAAAAFVRGARAGLRTLEAIARRF
ncbi:hypothetical protein [Vulcanimicrobium alpinum]|uniref:phosphorylase family protein n=1 Tax=Vulcanimicrobium alpinum TaxID=3016050 RepID=UPI00295F59D3|nr:hypothetical protein [Vulcanimicrobium alpinum]